MNVEKSVVYSPRDVWQVKKNKYSEQKSPLQPKSKLLKLKSLLLFQQANKKDDRRWQQRKIRYLQNYGEDCAFDVQKFLSFFNIQLLLNVSKAESREEYKCKDNECDEDPASLDHLYWICLWLVLIEQRAEAMSNAQAQFYVYPGLVEPEWEFQGHGHKVKNDLALKEYPPHPYCGVYAHYNQNRRDNVERQQR